MSSTPPKPSKDKGHRLARRLAALRSKYAQRVEEDLAELEALLDLPEDKRARRSAFERARHIAHKLHGSSGTIGLTAFSEELSSIHLLLGRCLANPKHADRMLDPIQACLQAAREHLQGQASPPTSGSEPPDLPARTTAQATILVVDDDPNFLEFVQTVARERGILALTAQTEAQALKLAQEEEIDGAIIDVHLGDDQSCFGLSERIRALPGYERLPWAVLTAQPTPATRIAAAQFGVSLFVSKPIRAETLYDTALQLASLKRVDQPHVLLVDDDPDFGKHITQMLDEERIQIVYERDAGKIVDCLVKHQPELLLLDVSMPDVSGFDVCKVVRATPEWNALPIVFLTADSSVETRLQCYRSGADDYLQKPALREELVARIQARVERARMAKDRTTRDALTGLMLRRAFTEAFEARLAEAHRIEQAISFALLDLDRFKLINDRYGHLAGDRVLTGLGKLLLNRFRYEDLRGRWGGEEFVIALMHEDAPTSRRIFNRVLDEFKALSFVGDNSERFHVSFSAGIATYPADGESLDELLQVADRRLYEAKHAGRGRVQIGNLDHP